MKPRHPGDQRRIVRIPAVAVNLAEILEEQPDVIFRVRPLRMARKQQPLPRTQVRVELAAQFVHFAPDALDVFRRRVCWIGKPAQLEDVSLQRINLALALPFDIAGVGVCGHALRTKLRLTWGLLVMRRSFLGRSRRSLWSRGNHNPSAVRLALR